MARAIRASGLLKPNPIRVMSRILVFDRFDPSVGQAVLDRGEDRGPVFHDPPLEVDEGVDPAASGPADPVVECDGGLVVTELEHGAESLFEQVGPPQPWFGLRDPVQFDPLIGVQIRGVLPQRVTGMLQRFGVSVGAAGAALGDRAAGSVPCFAADLVQGLGGPGDDVERVGAAHRVRAAFGRPRH